MAPRKRKSVEVAPPVNVEIEQTPNTPEKSDTLNSDIDEETNILAQVIARRIMKESKRHKPSVRNTNYAEQCLQLKKINNSLTMSFNVIEEEVKKLKKNIACNSDMINSINDDMRWTKIIDVTKKGRGLVVHYIDDDDIEYTTKLQEYIKMKQEEKVKYGSKKYIMNPSIMSKIIEIYTDKNNTEVAKETKILDGLDVIITDHRSNDELFINNKDFYSKYQFIIEENNKETIDLINKSDTEEEEVEDEEEEEDEEDEEEDDEEDEEEEEEE